MAKLVNYEDFMRRINGSGSVYKLKDKPRHKPWVAMSSKKNIYGKTEKKVVGYYATKKEAVTALDAFNVDPFARSEKTTLNDVYLLWYEEFSFRAAPKTIKSYSNVWQRWEPFFNRLIAEIRVSDLQHHLDTIDRPMSIKTEMKKVITSVYDFAVKNDYVKKNAGYYLHVLGKNEPIRPHSVYSNEEVEKLWNHKDEECVPLQLMVIYSGCRIGEIVDLDPDDVDLQNRTFRVRQSKTKAGVRTVPIADKTYPLWEKFVEEGGIKMGYDTIRKHWQLTMARLNMHHTPHDGRHTAISRMTAAGIDARIIKKIVGHKAKDVTEDVYTHVDLEVMRNAINKI